MNLGDLLMSTYERHWYGAKGEHTAMANAQQVVDILGTTLDAAEVTEVHLETLITSLKGRGNKAGTINRKLAALSKMLRHGSRLRVVTRLPVIEKLKEPRGRVRWLTRVEEKELNDTFRAIGQGVMCDLVVVLVDTGLRLSEALGLTWIQVDDAWVSLWDTKNGEERRIPMTERVARTMKSRRPHPKGPFQGITKAQSQYQWNRARHIMGLTGDKEFVLHALRHTFCSRLVQKGVPLATVQKLAGHKDFKMTLRYSHLAPGDSLDAIKKLEEIDVETK